MMLKEKFCAFTQDTRTMLKNILQYIDTQQGVTGEKIIYCRYIYNIYYISI